MRVEEVPDPQILNARDAIVKVTSTAICGSDLHLYNGSSRRWRRATSSATSSWARSWRSGRGVKNLKVGDRVVVPFPIACGALLRMCAEQLYSLCENSNPERVDGGEALGPLAGGLFGYSHLLGGYAGGQAEYARVPFADVGPIKVPDGLSDEQVLFLSDILPTGYMARRDLRHPARRRRSRSGAAGPVGQFAIASALLLGAERVIAIDRFPVSAAHGARAGRRDRDDQLRGGRRARTR